MFFQKPHLYRALTTALLAGLFSACGRDYNDTGVEYAPDMYHSVAYEPLKQITDTTAGKWRGEWGPEDQWGDFYNSNPNNPHRMTMRYPPKGTIARRNYVTSYGNGDSAVTDLMVYNNIGPDDLELASRTLKNPVPENEQTLAEGKILYERFCQHCHGEEGKGNGLVAAQYKGVPSYSSDAIKNVSGGHIFHVITHGKGRMWPHGSQMNPMERWKIVQYVQTLQKK